MIDNLPLIYLKIENIKNVSQEDFEEYFYQLCNLIESNLNEGNLWISLLSYYNLFHNMIKFQKYGKEDNFFLIIHKAKTIIEKIAEREEEIIEISLNNPFNNKQLTSYLENFDDKLSKKLIEEIKSINSLLPKLNINNFSDLYSFREKLSTHNFLKLIKIAHIKINLIDYKNELRDILIENIKNKALKQKTEIISEIIDFGIKNKDDTFIDKLLEETLLKLIFNIYSIENHWKETFIISTYENIARYFRIINKKEISIITYILAAMENFKSKNYGYCAKCIYKIYNLISPKNISLLYLSIKLASMETSFDYEINEWQKELRSKQKENIEDPFKSLINTFQKYKHYIENREFSDEKLIKSILASIEELKSTLNFLNTINKYNKN